MTYQVYFENKLVSEALDAENILKVKEKIYQEYGIPAKDLYITVNGRIAASDMNLSTFQHVVRVFLKTPGGKGGFGALLRSIGAQIHKIDNHEACREIHDEERLRKWLSGQEERKRNAVERKQKKIERLIAEPVIDVHLNDEYKKELEEIPGSVSAAVDVGWQVASTSRVGNKRKATSKNGRKKKVKLWIDANRSDCSSVSEGEDEELKKDIGTEVNIQNHL